jgi:hypothetical protein
VARCGDREVINELSTDRVLIVDRYLYPLMSDLSEVDEAQGEQPNREELIADQRAL